MGFRRRHPRAGRSSRARARRRSGSLEADDVRGPVWAGREAQQHELKTGRRAIKYSTISFSLSGGRPCSSVGDSSGPFPAASPIAGVTWPAIAMMPCCPYVQPVAELVLGCCRADRRELHVDGGIPSLAVQGRAVDQMQEVRAEGKRRGHRGAHGQVPVGPRCAARRPGASSPSRSSSDRAGRPVSRWMVSVTWAA